jgi:hypothetical protein
LILRRYGFPAAFARRLPQANGSPAPFTAPRAASPAQRKTILSCAQQAHVPTRATRRGDAQGGTADDGPGGEPGGEPGGGERAGERAGGGWDNGEGSGRSDGVVVERGSRQMPAQNVDQWQMSPLQTGIRLARQGRLLRLVSSYLPAQLHARCMTGCESGWAAY